MRTALFRFEASPIRGAGHAIRSSVLVEALQEKGWSCSIVTSEETYEFIKELEKFPRVDPETFYAAPSLCDLLVIDNYDIDEVYEKHFRAFAKKIMVIDDLADRKHDCDILLDQTFGREEGDYKDLVPPHCKILAGSDYVLLRKEFVQLQPKALEKRRTTTQVNRILISMGGGDSKNYTLKALEMIKASEFKSNIDIVLGFSSKNFDAVKKYTETMANQCTIHINADMPTLIYEADLAIGAAGSSVWERCCLGLPQVLVKTACNQSFVLIKISSHIPVLCFEDESCNETFANLLEKLHGNYVKLSQKGPYMVDDKGLERIFSYV